MKRISGFIKRAVDISAIKDNINLIANLNTLGDLRNSDLKRSIVQPGRPQEQAGERGVEVDDSLHGELSDDEVARILEVARRLERRRAANLS